MGKFKKGDSAHIDFVSESATEFSGNRFTGDGVIDRAEDGYLFGRLDNGRTFMCMESDATPIQATAQGYRKDFDKAMMFIFLAFAAVVLKLLGV